MPNARWPSTASRLETASPAEVLRELAASVGTEGSPVAPRNWRSPSNLVLLRPGGARRSGPARCGPALSQHSKQSGTVFLDDHDQARIYALVPYLIMVGADINSTQVATAELRKIFELIFELVEPARLPKAD